jgi:hypothetical protein
MKLMIQTMLLLCFIFISISKVETTGFQPVRFHLPILL